MYLGINPATCLWEIFGDYLFDNAPLLAQLMWDNYVISAVEVPPISVCDLSKTTTRGALCVDMAALMHPDVSIPQEWGLAIQKHPAMTPGIKYKSRFTGDACLAIFDRDAIRKQLRPKRVAPLNQSEDALNWLTKQEVALV